MADNRFVNNILTELLEINRCSIVGYEDSPFLTLEAVVDAITPPIVGAMDYVANAKKNCNQYSGRLMQNESAAIYLYTMPTPFFSNLNTALRTENREALKPWFGFLNLLITALKKLPSTQQTVWRGVNYDDTLAFVDDNVRIWWSVNSCSTNPDSVEQFLGENGTLFAIDSMYGKNISEFSAMPNEQEIVLMPGTRVRRKREPLNFNGSLFVVHLEEIDSKGMSYSESHFLYQAIRQEYQRHSHIEYLMDPAKSFSNEQSYINLTRVRSKDQYKKDGPHRALIYEDFDTDSFGEIYGVKTAIDVRSISAVCNNRAQPALVYGEAGSGKSTLCRYIAYQWATCSYSLLGELVVLIPLRHLTTDRYPPHKDYSLIDLVKTEILPYDLSEKEEKLFREQFDAQRIVWLLDGYDEIVQSVPSHLECLFEQLMKTPRHILTSRPISHTLSYDLQIEITGFTDENIEKYVQQFFNIMKDESDDLVRESQALLKFLQSNISMECIARHPMNLELICSLWNYFDWSETKQLTITKLYNLMTERLCRQYLLAQNISLQQVSKAEMHQQCQKQLAFLESLAFNTMQSNTIIIPSNLLEKALNEAKIFAHERQRVLGLGFLKSQAEQGFGTHIETNHDHYFIHLSFQEYFAARYLINTLVRYASRKAIDFIKYQKYNPRYMSVFTFAAGILSESNAESATNIFWSTLLSEPLDLVGIRHMQLVICCLEETSDKANMPQRNELLQSIARCIQHNVSIRDNVMLQQLSQSLQRAPLTVCDELITSVLINLLQCSATDIRIRALDFISAVKICNPPAALINSIRTTLSDPDDMVRKSACKTLGELGKKVVTNELISQLVIAVDDESVDVRISACKALESMGQKAATNEVISRLTNVTVDESGWMNSTTRTTLSNMGKKATTDELLLMLASALRGERSYIRWVVSKILEKVDEKAVLNEVISTLVSALGDVNEVVRIRACDALEIMDEKAATTEMISKLVDALEDESEVVRAYAYDFLGRMGVKASANEVINALVRALGDVSENVRIQACDALGRIGEKAQTSEMICALISALSDVSEDVRLDVCLALYKMGEKAVTDEVTNALMSALSDTSEYVRVMACTFFRDTFEKVMTIEIISKLVNALEDESKLFRLCACQALHKIDDNAIRNKVINTLVSVLSDANEDVRRLACEVFEVMGEKAATNEAINQLVSVLGDENDYVKKSACVALENMGEKAEINKVVKKLGTALEDESESVRIKACVALEQMGEKVVTNEVINELVKVVRGISKHVRERARTVLGNMGKKVTTNQVISQLVNALGDESEGVRMDICETLDNIGQKVTTDEVVNKLMNAVGDLSEHVREKACEVIGKMSEKVATNPMIRQLVSVLGDESEGVRMDICKILDNIGRKVTTDEVVNKLMNAVGDLSEHVREKACEALGKMSEKVATNQVISRLVNAVGDANEHVRAKACEALSKMGEKAATDDVINKLTNAVGDENEHVREEACYALAKMGEKVATNEVISELVNRVSDESEDVRASAYYALRKIGLEAATIEVIAKLASASEDKSIANTRAGCYSLYYIIGRERTSKIIKTLVNALKDESEYHRRCACCTLGVISERAATEEVLGKLMNLVGDESERVRASACEALGNIGEKAATDEVIIRLVNALQDVSEHVREKACYALGEMGEKTVTKEVLKNLVNLIISDGDSVHRRAADVLKNICRSNISGKQLGSQLISDLCQSERGLKCLENISVEELIISFFTTKKRECLTMISRIMLLRGVAMSVLEGRLTIYGWKKSSQLDIPNSELDYQLMEAFRDQVRSLHLDFGYVPGV